MTTTFFQNKVYAITGVSGIGLAVAKQLRQLGAKVSLADIDEKALADAAQQLSNINPNNSNNEDVILTTKLDVSSASAVDSWISATVDKFGRLDGAANMAGAIGKHHGVRALVDQDDGEWDLIFRVNVTGLKNCLRAELRAISAGDWHDNGENIGSIVNASSIQGLQGFALHAAYSASKHAVTGLTRSVAKEVAPKIRVNAIAPGSIQTPLLDKAKDIQGGKLELPCAYPRVGTADEVAQAVVYLLSDASSYTTGTILSVDGGWNC